jgi:2,6-dihydroxypyridine 3-monooxygenase
VPRPPIGPRVAVVGGSLGGLIAALQLRDADCDVQVYERSPTPLEGRGAGIVLHPETTWYLEHHGLIDLGRVSSFARTLRYLSVRGDVVLEEPIAYRFTSYATLYAALVGYLEPERYHLGHEVTGLEGVDGGVDVSFRDGGVERFGLVVGADGIRSTVRSLLFPDARPRYAGYVGWRGTLPIDRIPASVLAPLGGVLAYHVGDRTHVLSYEIPVEEGGGGARSMNWVWYRNVPAGEPLDSLLTDRDGARHDLSLPPGAASDEHVLELRSAAEALPPPFLDLVRSTPEPFVQVIVDIESPAMVAGRVCIIGDAAFALRPHIAVGTAKAAVDARRLAEELSDAEGDLDRALRRWEPDQLALGRATLDRTREVGERAQVTGTFVPGDASVAFGLREPKDGNFPDLAARD